MGCLCASQKLKYMTNKTKIIIIVIALGIIALGVGVFFAWKNSYKNQESPLFGLTATDNQILINNKLSQNKLRIISKGNAIAFSSINTSSTIYLNSNGNVNLINGENEEIISNAEIKNIQYGFFSANGKFIVAVSIIDNENVFNIFDVSKKTWTPPMSKLEALTFSPDEKSVLTGIQNKNIYEIYTANSDLLGIDGYNPVKIFSLSGRDFNLTWVNNDMVLLSSKPSKDYVSDIWSLNLKTKSLTKIFSGNGIMLGWDKFGEMGLKFQNLSEKRLSFAVVNKKGEEKGAIKAITFPEKCFISSVTQFYCGISQDQTIFSKVDFPDDYLNRNVSFKDGIYQIDILSNTLVPLYISENPILDIKNPVLNGNQLLFINRYDNRLYSLSL